MYILNNLSLYTYTAIRTVSLILDISKP